MATSATGLAVRTQKSSIPEALTINMHDRDLLRLAESDRWIRVIRPSAKEKAAYQRLVENGIFVRDEGKCKEQEASGNLAIILSDAGAAFYEQFRKVFSGAKAKNPWGAPEVIVVQIGPEGQKETHIVDLA